MKQFGPTSVYSSSSLPALQPCVSLGFVTVNFSGVGSLTSGPTSHPGIPGATLRLASTYLEWVALSGAYIPASIGLPITGAHTPPLHHTAVSTSRGLQYIIPLYATENSATKTLGNAELAGAKGERD
jgi:hypothetical protein